MNRIVTPAALLAALAGVVLIVTAFVWPEFAPAEPPPGRDPAHLHYAEGVGLLSAGDLLGARTELREALRLRPDHADAHYHLGLSLKLGKQEAEATQEFLAAARGGVPRRNTSRGRPTRRGWAWSGTCRPTPLGRSASSREIPARMRRHSRKNSPLRQRTPRPRNHNHAIPSMFTRSSSR